MSRYSYEFSYYFGVMVSTVFAMVYVLYIMYIVVLAGLKFYSDCFYFLYKLYQNDFNFSQTVFIVFKDFVRYFIDDMAQVEMLAAKKTLFNDTVKKGFDLSSIEKISGFLKENKAEINKFSRDQFFTLKFACHYSNLKDPVALNEHVKAKLSIAGSTNEDYVKAFDKVLSELYKLKNKENELDYSGDEKFFLTFIKFINGLNRVSYASNEEFHKFNGELLRELEKSEFVFKNDDNGNKLKDFITFIHCFKDTDTRIKSGLIDSSVTLLYVDLLKGSFGLTGISNESNIDQVRLPKFFGSYYKDALPIFVTQKMLSVKDPLTGHYFYKVAGDLCNFDEKLKLFLFEELKARDSKVVNRDLDALIKATCNDDMSVILNNKDNLFSSVFKQLGRVPEEQRGLTIYNRDVEGNPKILDNLAYKFSGLNREALPVAKVTLLGPNAEPLMVYMKK